MAQPNQKPRRTVVKDKTREAQYQKLAQARRWARNRNYQMFEKFVKEAEQIREITEMQWWFLRHSLR